VKNKGEEKMFEKENDPIGDYENSDEDFSYGTNQQKGISKPLIAGILLIIAGALGLMTWISLFGFDITMIDPSLLQTDEFTISPEDLQSMLQICAVVGVILSVFPILGGILAIKRKLWGVVLVCSILGIFTVGPVFISSILAVIALILIATTKKDFIQKETTPIKEYDEPFE